MAEPKRAENSSRSSERVSTDGPDETAPKGASSAEKLVAVPTDLSGRVLGDFCLLRKLGKGGMAEVYLAEQTSLHRQVAIKIMRPEFVADPQYVKRFRHEASAAGGLNHPNIVQVYMVGEQDGIHFISQEYVQGRNLKEFITRKGPLDIPIALHVLKQVAAALQVAAEKGIVHRDIKPENILLTRKGEAKVADFGLAQLTLGGERVSMTQEGVTMGTPLYMSPEQVNGRPLDGRSDIYSLGVMAWHMLAGYPPFSGETAISVAVKHLNEQPPSLKDVRSDIPVGLRTLIEKMMAKKREDRPADAQAVLNELKQLLRQATNKEVPVAIESVFRPSKGSTSQFSASLLLKRPLRLHLSRLLGACLLVAFGSAGVGWAMRTSDPLKTKSEHFSRVQLEGTIKAQYQYAQTHSTDEGAWCAVKDKIKEKYGDAPDPIHARMLDRCEAHLAMIYIHARRYEKAREIFNEFIAGNDLWKRAHGLAGLAIVDDVQGGDIADRLSIRQRGQQVENYLRQLVPPDGRLELVFEAALRDVMRRSER